MRITVLHDCAIVCGILHATEYKPFTTLPSSITSPYRLRKPMHHDCSDHDGKRDSCFNWRNTTRASPDIIMTRMKVATRIPNASRISFPISLISHPRLPSRPLQASGNSISPIENRVFPTLSLRICANPRASRPLLVLCVYRTKPC